MKDHGVSGPLFHLRDRVGDEVQASDLVTVSEQRLKRQGRDIVEGVEGELGIGTDKGVRV